MQTALGQAVPWLAVEDNALIVFLCRSGSKRNLYCTVQELRGGARHIYKSRGKGRGTYTGAEGRGAGYLQELREID